MAKCSFSGGTTTATALSGARGLSPLSLRRHNDSYCALRGKGLKPLVFAAFASFIISVFLN